MSVSVDRRPVVVSVAVGIVVLAVGGMSDRLVLGVFVCAGMALGVLNAWLNRVAVGRILSDIGSGKQVLAAATGLRLFGITALALIVCVLMRPDGFGILFGLVAFQIVLLLGAAVPAWRGAR
ncbi:hypothetical protein [Nocardia transvalensis]|uniref:hypothetical protein n=1 Tax=Nocardia transvalensis TaxID=37333 RepID=UPI0018961576|nr:hypothetical protein [Nocardia transvalensis]MBF6327655.1 hypothetical protein [Nocardia transvalensis]